MQLKRGLALSLLAVGVVAGCAGSEDFASNPEVRPGRSATVPLPPEGHIAPAAGEDNLSAQAIADYDEVEWAIWPTQSASDMPPSAIWIAHPRLPLPAYVELTRIDTGRTIIARAATRPASSNATAPVELSQGAARLLGLAPDGQAAFRVRRLTPSLQERTALRLGQPGAARLDTPESLLVILRRKAAQLPSARVPDNHPQKNEAGMIRLQPATPLAKGDLGGRETPSKVVAASRWYIQITAVSRAEKAHDLARQLAGSVSATGGLFRVRTGPYPSLDAARAALGPIRARGYPDARLTR